MSESSQAEIKIIGFQSPDSLAIEDNIKHSYFIYPDEDVSELADGLLTASHTQAARVLLRLCSNRV